MSQKDGAVLLPFYLVCDVSYSMDGEKLDSVNQMLPQVADALAKNPILTDKVRFGLVDFSDDARTVLPLCDLSQEDKLPGLSCRGGTSYAAAFTTLRQQIESDVRQLRADGFRVHRPAVFFLSDGAPTDDEPTWRAAWKALSEWDKSTQTGFRWRPNVVPFGVAGADRKILQQLVLPVDRSRLYMMKEGATAGPAIAQMAEILISSVLQSGMSAVEGNSGLLLPNAEDVGDEIDVIEGEDWLD